MKELFDKIVAYFQDNPIYFYIAVVIAVLIVVVIIAMIILGVKRSKAKKAAAADAESAKPAVPAESKSNIAAAGKPSETPLSYTKEADRRAAESQPEPVLTLHSYEEKQEKVAAPAMTESRPGQTATIRSAASVNRADAPAADTLKVAETKEPECAPQPEQTAAPVQKVDAPAASDVSGSATPAQERVKAVEPKAKQIEKQPNASRRRAAERQNTMPAEQTVSNADSTKPHDAEEEKRPAYSGKWVISKNEDTGLYSFELRASNGEKLLGSIEYTSVSGAKNGIKTHKNNIAKGNIVISQNKKGQYFFRLLNGSKQLLCTGETYPTKAGCESAVESVKRFAETAVITVKDEQEEE